MPHGLSSLGILEDVKFGARSLRRHPLVTVVAILTLTRGIGVNTRPVIAGMSAGLLLAVAGSVALGKISTESGIFRKASSPVVFVVTFLLLQVAALIAMLGPAISAVRKDPVNALRQE